MAGPSVQFLGRLPDAEVKQQLSRCRAFIFPGEEDFGLTPLEAMASGRPVIAFAGGGALETVKPGLSGAFFSRPSAESLAAAVQSFDDSVYDPYAIRRYAEGFDRAVFTVQLTDYINQLTGRVTPVPDVVA